MNKTVPVVPMYRGNTKRFVASLLNKNTGLPIALAGASTSFSVVSRKTGATLFTKTNAVGGGITYSENVITIEALPADTASAALGDYDAKAVVTFSTAEVSTVLHFILRLE